MAAALAQPVRADDTPWTVGVTAEQKASAHTLLEAGNTLFLQRDYTAALEKYRAAVAAWDHPAIRFNMVRCLIQLDRTVEAADNLKLALRYGAAPLEDKVYSEALAYEKLLALQVSDVDVSCDQAGVAVTLDGKPLLSCPGKQSRRVTPGPHQLVATKEGFLTKTSDVIAIGGQHEAVMVALKSIDSAAIVHRWPTWKPWLVFGAGIAVVGIGGLFEYQAAQDMSSYDKALALACADTGCSATRPIPTNLADQKTRATHENDIAIGVTSVGVAAAAAGGVLLYMNRGHAAYAEKVLDRVDVSTVRGGATVGLRGHF